MCEGTRLLVPCMALLLLALALSCSATLNCKGPTYPSGSRCCNECQPGYGMESRCDDSGDTVCQLCKPGYYNEAFNYEACRPCTQCNERSGSESVQSCTPTRDTVCHCRPGTQPQGGYKPGVDCAPCPPGHFSPGHNQACKPWTDCTSTGKRTLQPASNSSDAVCEDRSPPATTLLWSTQHLPALPTPAQPTTAQPGASQRPPEAPTGPPRGKEPGLTPSRPCAGCHPGPEPGPGPAECHGCCASPNPVPPGLEAATHCPEAPWGQQLPDPHPRGACRRVLCPGQGLNGASAPSPSRIQKVLAGPSRCHCSLNPCVPSAPF
ncbi:tumor necrosis factor receptor superfamily member 4 isoform X1 [Elephas maximus indicus]|uniref:tumor necrosis factor receptor superfamily member 4 isoform X1 n=1 Tax=Elephas maximus indicus TaxID=99487 RepID=UPI0021162830|nr:tumor necrosis factor receptor superfamily member 4 isoform X1 [Elephas maximus indicus]